MKRNHQVLALGPVLAYPPTEHLDRVVVIAPGRRGEAHDDVLGHPWGKKALRSRRFVTQDVNLDLDIYKL